MSQDPKIGYDNLFERGTVTATSAHADYPVENAFDGFTDDFWRPNGTGTQRLAVALDAPEEVDYFALAAHDLATHGVSVRLQCSADGVTWTNVGNEVLPATNAPLMIFVPPSAHLNWALRFTVPAGKTVHVGVAHIGVALELPIGFFVGYAPPKLNPQVTYLNSNSDSGKFIGRSVIREGINDQLSLSHVSPEWVRQHWVPFANYAKRKPFFLAWYPSKYPDDVAYVWTTNAEEVTNALHKYQAAKMSLRGIAG